MKSEQLRKTFRSMLCIALSIAFLLSVMPTAFAAGTPDVIGKYNYTIKNPYQAVNWDTWRAYRGATHVHTVRSDGNVELNDMIEDYYAHGYQCLALTDHGTVNYSWTKDQTRLAIFGYQFFVHGNVDEISEERYRQITTGSDRNGDPMIEIPLGIELNGSSTSKCHVNSYFADCGHGDLEMSAKWPEDAVKKCEKAGGTCHINHVGEWTDGKDDIKTYDTAFVQKFAKLFTDYKSCIGMELVNTRDNRTHNDRYLYDETLKLVAPTGKNIMGFCEDDSHDPEDVGNNAQFFVMPQNTWQNVRTSMETGAFFACSQTSKNAWELGDGFQAQGDFPMVSRVEVDEQKDQISFTAYNANKIKIVADGVVLDEKTVYSDTPVTFDLNKYEDSINSYVRFYLTGAGGICYPQPFLVSKNTYDQSVAAFTLNPVDAKLTVKDSQGQVIEASNEKLEYALPQGTYSYTVEKSDYETATGTFEIGASAARQNIEVKLDKVFIYSTNESKYTVDYSHMLFYGVDNPNKLRLTSAVRPGSGVSLNFEPTEYGYGTGTLITAKDTQGSTRVYEFVLFGDLTGDGIFDGRDAAAAQALKSGMQYGTEAHRLAADCDRSGQITDSDVEKINQCGVLADTISQN